MHPSSRIRSLRSFAAATAAAALALPLGLALTGGATAFAAPAPEAPVPGQDSVRINEVVSSGGSPDDWVELVNIGSEPVNLEGWYLLDNDDSKEPSVFPNNTVIAPGEYLVVDRDELGFGLGKGDMARLFTPTKVEVDRAAWPEGTHAEPSLHRCPEGRGEFTLSTAATKGKANACSGAVVISEVNVAEGFVELQNRGSASVDVGGWAFFAGEGVPPKRFPSGTVIKPGEFWLVPQDFWPSTLQADMDNLLLMDAADAPGDSVGWLDMEPKGFALCGEDMVTPQRPTPGEENACPAPDAGAPLPTTGTVTTADNADTWSEDLSGLDLQTLKDGSEVLWATNNNAGEISRLVRKGYRWVMSEGWPAGGVPTRFADGTGAPDGEGISVGLDGRIYLGVERDNDKGGTSRNTVLAFEVPSRPGAELVAAEEWAIGDVLPATDANKGVEAIEMVPAQALERLGGKVPTGAKAYAIVALEATGDAYALALMPEGKAELIGTLDSPLEGLMALDYQDRTRTLWAFCDEVCEGRSVTFDLGADGAPASRPFARVEGMANIANEGVAISGAVVCAQDAAKGTREIWFADDADSDGHSLRGAALTGQKCPGSGPGAPGDDDQPGAPEKPEQPGKPEKPEQPEQPGKPEKPEQPGTPGGDSGAGSGAGNGSGGDLARTGTDAAYFAGGALALLGVGLWLIRRSRTGN